MIAAVVDVKELIVYNVDVLQLFVLASLGEEDFISSALVCFSGKS